MTKTLLAFSAAAMAFTAAPSLAQTTTVAKGVTCTKYVNGQCTETHKVKYKVGYTFGPTYSYTPMSDIPQTVVTQYSLSPDYKYVSADGNIYVVDPHSYKVTRVIEVPAQ
jgi:hypothetical protein